jgi:hypothetical protein
VCVAHGPTSTEIFEQLFAGVLALVVAGPTRILATLEAGQIGEAQVKAAFLFNFTKFVEWPGSSEGPLVIGVVSNDGFADIVTQTVRGRNADGREVQTRRLAIGDELSGCHVVFVGAVRPRDTAELMQRVRGPVLTVGDTVQFLRDGGMVRFYVESNKVRFEISQKNVEQAGLRISSQLLMLAR